LQVELWRKGKDGEWAVWKKVARSLQSGWSCHGISTRVPLLVFIRHLREILLRWKTFSKDLGERCCCYSLRPVVASTFACSAPRSLDLAQILLLLALRSALLAAAVVLAVRVATAAGQRMVGVACTDTAASAHVLQVGLTSHGVVLTAVGLLASRCFRMLSTTGGDVVCDAAIT
jgi:hypothetical protein